jgi:hypothetical protein
LVLVIFPNGIGPREVILIAALAPVLDRPAALALALLARVTTTISDLAWGAIALFIGRRAIGRTAGGRHRGGRHAAVRSVTATSTAKGDPAGTAAAARARGLS